MARLTKQQLRVMEQRDRRNTRQAATGVVALTLILAGALWGLLWWFFVILPVLCFRFARKLTWRGWVVVGVLLAAGIVYGLINSSR
ncbi:MAG: hypothetical protein ACREP9_00255 [Candidatus Dormibacteraceae bacterium]